VCCFCFCCANPGAIRRPAFGRVPYREPPSAVFNTPTADQGNGFGTREFGHIRKIRPTCFGAFASRDPASTPHHVRGRLSLENAPIKVIVV
jgi:hypothetical protein